MYLTYRILRIKDINDFLSEVQKNVRKKNSVNLLLKIVLQWKLDLRKPDLRKNLDLRKIVGTTNFLVHKLFDLRKIF